MTRSNPAAPLGTHAELTQGTEEHETHLKTPSPWPTSPLEKPLLQLPLFLIKSPGSLKKSSGGLCWVLNTQYRVWWQDDVIETLPMARWKEHIEVTQRA